MSGSVRFHDNDELVGSVNFAYIPVMFLICQFISSIGLFPLLFHHNSISCCSLCGRLS